MLHLRRVVAVVILLLVHTAAHAESKTVRLLTVGNSFADNALSFLPQIAEAGGDKLIFARANLGGCSLERHWGLVEKYEADHDDKTGHPYNGGKFSLAEMLKQDAWDVVTIQQYSFISHDLSTYEPFAKNLNDYIHQHAPQAKVLIQQIWAYRVDDPRFNGQDDGKQPRTQKAMYEQVRAAYHAVAKELNIGILPSGDAMYIADSDPTWGYAPDKTFDFAHAAAPALPDQTHSLHAGYSWSRKSGTEKLGMDGHHASSAGRYLIGCVWYEVLFDRNVENNPFVPPGLDADYARFLRQTAHKAVMQVRDAK
ncbi:MAG: DUF4886 domain-containing protein [Planctomycetes bacterium]|nr:DUF4886 domain-containing protein [Planctomycetota bacterium]